MPDTSTPNLAEITSPDDADLVHAVDVSAVDPKDRRLTFLNLWLWIRGKISEFFGEVYVASYATGGSGTSGDPWTGWEFTPESNTKYFWRAGWYATAGWSVDFGTTQIHDVTFDFEETAVIQHTGSGVAITWKSDSGHTPTWKDWFFNFQVHHLTIEGNASTTDGVLLRGCRFGLFFQPSIRNISGAAWRLEACVNNQFIQPICSLYETGTAAWTTTPAYHFYLDKRASDSSQTTCTLIDDPVSEGIGTVALYFKDTWFNQVRGGTSEICTGKGVQEDSTCKFNTFQNHDCEQNGGKDWDLHGLGTVVTNCIGTSNVANSATFDMVYCNVSSGKFANADIPISGSGVFSGVQFITTNPTIDSLKATFVNCTDADGNFIIGKQPLAFPGKITVSGSTGTYTPSAYFEFYDFVEPSGAVTFDNPSGTAKDGQPLRVRIRQATPGGQALTFGTKFKGPSGSIPANSTGDATISIYEFRYYQIHDIWHLTSSSVNLSGS